MPGFAGNDFVLGGYRIFVRYTNTGGKKRRGLYILRSETSSRSMQLLGNVFTHYNYQHTDLDMKKSGDIIRVESLQSGLSINAKLNSPEPLLPAGSPFSSWREARKFAGPMPFTFDILKHRRILIIEGRREHWNPEPVEILHATVPFLTGELATGTLANAFIIQDVPYYWKKGVIETF